MALNQHIGWLYSTSLEDKEMALISQTKMLHKFSHRIIQQHVQNLYWNNARILPLNININIIIIINNNNNNNNNM